MAGKRKSIFDISNFFDGAASSIIDEKGFFAEKLADLYTINGRLASRLGRFGSSSVFLQFCGAI
jgi:hypothetical protein